MAQLKDKKGVMIDRPSMMVEGREFQTTDFDFFLAISGFKIYANVFCEEDDVEDA
jgi:hypothetical protein